MASIGVDEVGVLASGSWRELEDVYLHGIYLDHREHREVWHRWLRAVPDTITQKAFAGSSTRHTRSDYLRMPPSTIVLQNIERSLRWGINAEQLEDLQLRARGWPEPLRSELQTLIVEAPRRDADG